jgi:hypothetical protein
LLTLAVDQIHGYRLEQNQTTPISTKDSKTDLPFVAAMLSSLWPGKWNRIGKRAGSCALKVPYNAKTDEIVLRTTIDYESTALTELEERFKADSFSGYLKVWATAEFLEMRWYKQAHTHGMSL